MADSECVDKDEVSTISDKFDTGLNLFNSLTKNYEPTNSLPIQCSIKNAMTILEDTTKLVSLSGIFSTNESIAEVSTNTLKLFLLPALLGTLSLKLCQANRLEVITTAETYFKDFLHRCNCYGIIDFDAPELEEEVVFGTETSSTQNFNIAKMACTRNIKIQRFKEQREMEKQIAELEISMQNLIVDDDIKRNYYLTLIRSFASQAIDELDCLNSEKPLIVYRAAMEIEPEKPMKAHRPHKPLQPIIITKDDMQKKIFGAGYPSLPVLTVEEFYEKRVQDGEFPDPNAPKPKALQDFVIEENASQAADLEAQALEECVEQDDPQLLKQKREMDDFKDTHRRGYGNRMNRS